ncbi:hypothetical protein OQA88_13571 [Cercophora sp. LCS_1]
MSTRRSARLAASTSVPQSSTPASTPAPTPDPAPNPIRKRKAAPDPTEPPSTPRRVRKAPALSTPTITTSTTKPLPANVSRLANPNLTNAPLFSPETSHIVTAKPLLTTPSKSTTTTTTATLLEEACAHLIEVDPRMKPLIEAHHCHIFSPGGLAEQVDPFEALASGIISQQVSGAAAKAIKARFVALFSSENSTRFPQPSQVAKTPLEKLRTAGLSQRKAEYLVGLAEKFATGELSAHLLAEAPYDEIVEKLTAVRGLGRWSVEMFACFGLKRMDVFSLGDLGVQRGMAAFVGRDVAKLKSKGGKWKYMSEKEMEEISERFRPYRSLFMWYMWRVEATDVSTME